MSQLVSITDARGSLADIANKVAYQGRRFVFVRRGKGVAALVSVDDLAVLEALEDASDVRAARKALKDRGSRPWEQIKKELGL